jgi:hypothetical protein
MGPPFASNGTTRELAVTGGVITAAGTVLAGTLAARRWNRRRPRRLVRTVLVPAGFARHRREGLVAWPVCQSADELKVTAVARRGPMKHQPRTNTAEHLTPSKPRRYPRYLGRKTKQLGVADAHTSSCGR